MKNQWMRVAALALAVLTAMPLLAACGERKVTVSDDPTAIPYVNDDGYSTRPTVFVPADQLTVMQVMTLIRPGVKWSELVGYKHTLVTDNQAEFIVADETGLEATMTVDFDKTGDSITKVIMTFRDVTADITNNGENFVELFKIINAMMAAYEEEE